MDSLLPTLLRLGSALGISAEALARGETADRVFVDTEIRCSAAQGIRFEHLRSAVDSWGSALTLQITSDYGVRDLHIQNGTDLDKAGFEGFREDLVQAAGDETVKVRLTLDKRLMLGKSTSARPGVGLVAYLFLSNLTRALDGSLEELGKLLFPTNPHCCCLVLDAPEFMLEGPYFAIWGRAVFEARYQKLRLGQANTIERARNIRSEHLSWLEFDTTLTPYHFFVRECGDCSAETYRKVLHLQYLLVVIYLADSVRYSNGVFVATFSGTERCEVAVEQPASSLPNENPDVTRLFMWAYSGRPVDKLPTLRSVMAATFMGDRRENYTLLQSNTQRIWLAARSNYAALVGGFVTKYFEKLKEVDEHVQHTGTEIADRISDLVKTLTGNLLAAVGVAVGGFIAYALDKKSSAKLLSIGLEFYGVYVLVFPLLYSLFFHGLIDFWITRADFTKRTSELEAALHIVGLTNKRSDDLKGRIRHFWFILASSALVYLAIGISCFVLAKLVDVPPPPAPRLP